MNTLFIFYVKDQARSTLFYSHVLAAEPVLNVPGMTEFELNDGCLLGLMPESGIKKLLPELTDPSAANGAPRAEVYLKSEKAREFFERALEAGATKLSDMLPRDWGHTAGYCLDPDGHVLAFAEVPD